MTNNDNAPSFKNKASGIGDIENNGTNKEVTIAVLLKYLSNFWRSIELPLINFKVELSLKCIENCVLTTDANASNATFKIPDAKLYVPVVTLSTEDNVTLSKLMSEGFNRPIYWNKYKVIDNRIVDIAAANEEKHIRCLILVATELKDCLFLLMTIQQVIIKFLIILLRNIFFHELRLKIATSKLTEEIFTINRLTI